MKPYLLTDVPEDIWDALRADAASRETPETFVNDAGRKYPSQRTERTGTSMNNVVAGVLAARYGLEFEPTNRATFSYERAGRSLYLRLPEHIMDAVVKASKTSTRRAAILLALAEHYLLEPPPPKRPPKLKKHGRPRGRKKKVA